MGRLDAVLGRSPADAEEPPAAAAPTELWLNQEPAAWSLTASDRDKGSR